MTLEIKENLSSDLYKAKGTLDNILNRIKNVINDENILFDVKLILNELVANSVIHGNCCDEKKKVNVRIKVNSSYIKIEVVDQGEGFKYNKELYNPFDLKCNGRGLVIVDGLSDEFYIDKNRVVSVKYL